MAQAGYEHSMDSAAQVALHAEGEMRLHDWLALGRRQGAISDVRTGVLAYCMDERRAIRWVASIVNGSRSEQAALAEAERMLAIEESLAYSG